MVTSKFNFVIVLILLASMALTTACSVKTTADATLLALEAVVDGSSALIATAASMQTPTGDVLLALTYAKLANDAAVKSIAEYGSSDALSVKIGLISGYWSQLAVPVLGQTNAGLIATGVASLTNLIQKLIQRVHPPAATAAFQTRVALRLDVPSRSLFSIEGLIDRHKLGQIDGKAKQNSAAAAKLIADAVTSGQK